MIASLTAAVVALTIGLPVFALGERIRGRGGCRRTNPHTLSTRKDVS